MQGILKDARSKSEEAKAAQPSPETAVPESGEFGAPNDSPDTYDPFQALDDLPLPGPPPKVMHLMLLCWICNADCCSMCNGDSTDMAAWPFKVSDSFAGDAGRSQARS